jgi:hypothetical protein
MTMMGVMRDECDDGGNDDTDGYDEGYDYDSGENRLIAMQAAVDATRERTSCLHR